MTAPRLIVTVVAAGVLMTSAGLTGTRLFAARAVPTATAATRSDRWLDGLTASHRQLFDAPSPEGGIPLVHVMNYYDTYNKAYSVGDRDIDAVLTFYGASTFYGLSQRPADLFGIPRHEARTRCRHGLRGLTREHPS
jgi:hypothetical protein